MSLLQEQLFVQAAAESLHRLTKDLQGKYEPKKGDRFNIKGITYEIGPPKFLDNKIQFEISSKIPGEELPAGYDEANYFKKIDKICAGAKKRPVASDMENIIRETRDQEKKERDYVKLTYQYASEDLFDEKEVKAEVGAYARDPNKKPPPEFPGTLTLAGRVILHKVGSSLYEVAESKINELIRANDSVRSDLKKFQSR